MKRRSLLRDGQPSLELIETAYLLLRQLSLQTWLIYLLGTLPFLTAFLYFWTDMASNALGEERLFPSAILLTGAFALAKVAQSFLADRLLICARQVPSTPWTGSRFFRVLALQLRWQPLGLILTPIAILLTAPAGWTISFFQTVTVAGGDAESAESPTASTLWKRARRWPLQNHEILASLSLLSLVIYLNLLVLTWGVPFLLKMLLGVESAFTQSPWSVLNSTVLIAILVVTGLILDPLVKAVYVLRCFLGDSIQDGADLHVELRRCQAARATATALVCFGLLALTSTQAADPARLQPPAQSRLSTEALDSAIDRTLSKREYVWRLPAETAAPETSKSNGFWENFWKKAGKAIKSLFDKVESTGSQISKWVKKLFSFLPPSRSGKQNVWFDWTSPIEILCYLAILLILAGILWIVSRWLRDRSLDPSSTSTVDAAASKPDLSQEEVHPNQLPEDGWIQLARECIAQGDLRLAMRAFYLASLAHLGSKQLLLLSTSKSNQDYLLELRRRAHAVPQTVNLFTENLNAFERVWYGRHEVTRETLNLFESRVRELRS